MWEKAGHCIGCGAGEDKARLYDFHVLTVRTLAVRDLDRHKKVQSLGDFADFAVCEECAAKRLAKDLSPVRAASRSLMGFGIVLVLGIALLLVDFLVLNRQLVFLMLGAFAVICGVLGLVSKWKDASERSEELRKMGEKEALYEEAWEELKTHAPKKDKDIDLTYIPVDQKTMQRKNGDLMILYDLLPEIALQAYDRVHREYSMNR